MAGKTIQEILVSRVDAYGLAIFLAMSKKGIVRIGLSLKVDLRGPVQFFRNLFPDAVAIHDPTRNAPIEKKLIHTLEGKPWSDEIPLDFHCTDFQLSVLKAISQIPFGSTMTYKDVAVMIGKPKACRAVGQALKFNPFPLIFP